MIDLSNINKIYVYKERCDLRMSITGLTILTSKLHDISTMPNNLFIYFGKNKRLVKILEVDTDGYWLYQKRLSIGSFKAFTDSNNINDDNTTSEEIEITKEEILLLLNGLDIKEYRLHKENRILINY